MDHDIETRRRRAAWRASHRGTKELDLLVGRFADTALGAMSEGELSRFERFLDVNDPQVEKWLLAPAPPADTEFADVVAAVRKFHGLDGA